MKSGDLAEFTKTAKENKKYYFNFPAAATGAGIGGISGAFMGANAGRTSYSAKALIAFNKIKSGKASVPSYEKVRKIFPKMTPKEYIGKSLRILGLGRRAEKIHIGKGVVGGALAGMALGALGLGLRERKKTAGQESSLFLGDMIADRSVSGLATGGRIAGKKEQARYRQQRRFGYKPKYVNLGEYTSAIKEPGGPASRWSEIS